MKRAHGSLRSPFARSEALPLVGASPALAINSPTSPDSRRPARITIVPDRSASARPGAASDAATREGQGCGAVLTWRTERARWGPGNLAPLQHCSGARSVVRESFALSSSRKSSIFERQQAPGPEPAEGFLGVAVLDSISSSGSITNTPLSSHPCGPVASTRHRPGEPPANCDHHIIERGQF